MKNPTDEHVKLLLRIAKAARDVDVVKLCEATLKDDPTARRKLLHEIAYGRHEAAFREAVLAS